MPNSTPRIVILADNKSESTNIAELNMQSVGYGLHLAWAFATLFGTARIFDLSVDYGIAFPSSVFIWSAVFYTLALLCFGILDGKARPFFHSKKIAVIAAIIMAVGTALVLLYRPGSPLGLGVPIVSGILTGLGSSTLLIYWGIAYSRTTPSTCTLNTAIALMVGVGIYSLFLHVLPYPLSGIVTAFLPLLEYLVLLPFTSDTYEAERSLPSFDPLPVKGGWFALFFGATGVILGIVLGYLRQMTTFILMPAQGAVEHPALLAGGAIAALLIILAGFALAKDDRPDTLARLLLPVAGIGLAVLPFASFEAFSLLNVIVIIGAVCLEGAAWILLCQMAQRYRISELLMFGIGRGSLALGMLMLSMAGLNLPISAQTTYFSPEVVLGLLLMLGIAIALIPHRHDIQHIRRLPEVASTETEELLDHVDEAQDARTAFEELTPVESLATRAHAADAAADIASALAAAARSDEGDVSGQTVVPDDFAGSPVVLAQESAGQMADGEAGTASAGVSGDRGRMRREATSGDAASSAIEADDNSPKSFFRKKCERIADRYLLSEREFEVLFFLARGYNTSYIQERLFISEGTAKTHIRHIYRKCNVHSQQELMSMVRNEWID